MKFKNLIYVMLCICVAFLMSGCNGGGQGKLTPTPTPTVVPTPTGAAHNITIAPPENMEVTIYSISSNTLEKKAISVLMSEVTAKSIVDEVVSAMKDEAFFVGINDVIPQGDTVIVDFKSTTPPVTDVGASVEGTILDVIAQSIIDNLSQYSKVIFRIEGMAYQTGHIEMGYDEIYMER